MGRARAAARSALGVEETARLEALGAGLSDSQIAEVAFGQVDLALGRPTLGLADWGEDPIRWRSPRHWLSLMLSSA
jgi:hypothetical protein